MVLLCARQFRKADVYKRQHYYSGKDDLFLLCVQNMYQMMQQYLEENMAELEKKDALHALKEFWMLRESFFGEHPPFKNIFENALLRTPPHLFEKIEEIRGPIEALNRQFLHRTIGKIELRENLKKENVSIYLEAMESVFWKLVEQYRREQRISDVHSLMAVSYTHLDVYKRQDRHQHLERPCGHRR